MRSISGFSGVTFSTLIQSPAILTSPLNESHVGIAEHDPVNVYRDSAWPMCDNCQHSIPLS